MHWRPGLDRKEAFKRYEFQRAKALVRGIEWKFTFDSWLEWWGDDLDRRGRGTFDLCMMRPGDVGPYSPENTRKGTVLQNGKSRGVNIRTKRSLAAYRALQDEIESTPAVAQDDLPDEHEEDARWLHENVGWGSHKPTAWS